MQWRGQAQETKLLLCIDIQHTHGQKDEALGCVWVIAMATGYIFSLFLSLSALAQFFFPLIHLGVSVRGCVLYELSLEQGSESLMMSEKPNSVLSSTAT